MIVMYSIVRCYGFYLKQIESMINYIEENGVDDVLVEADLMDLWWRLRKSRFSVVDIHEILELRERVYSL